jgi:hypothetical protein
MPSKCVLPWLVPAQRGRVAIVIADNLKPHTPAGSLLVREPGSPSARSTYTSIHRVYACL